MWKEMYNEKGTFSWTTCYNDWGSRWRRKWWGLIRLEDLHCSNNASLLKRGHLNMLAFKNLTNSSYCVPGILFFWPTSKTDRLSYIPNISETWAKFLKCIPLVQLKYKIMSLFFIYSSIILLWALLWDRLLKARCKYIPNKLVSLAISLSFHYPLFISLNSVQLFFSHWLWSLKGHSGKRDQCW